jgi:voltage-gated potassium channel
MPTPNLPAGTDPEDNGWQTRLRDIVESRETPAGRIFGYAIRTLIVLSLVAFSIETLPNLPSSFRRLLARFEILTVAIFTVEYALRILAARRRLRFIFSFYGLIDLLAILPFYVTQGIDLRSLRAFRFLRLLRALKLVRYSSSVQRLHTALSLVREDLVLFFCVALMLLYFSGVGIYFFEHEAQPDRFASIFHSLWWAVATLTTVGYGDIYPITLGGRLFTFGVLLLGLGVVSVPCGMLASALSEARRLQRLDANGGDTATDAIDETVRLG